MDARCPAPSCPDLCRASPSLLAASRTWMAGTSSAEQSFVASSGMTDRRQDPGKVTSCYRRALPSAVMPGLVPGIHVLARGHDGGGCRLVRLMPASYPRRRGVQYPEALAIVSRRRGLLD